MKDTTTAYICGDAMCPYIPCEDAPNCVHCEFEAEQEKRMEE